MIQANELRIGNRFTRELRNSRGLEYDRDFVLTEEWMGRLFGSNISFALQDLSPIPLTHEILGKAGFVKDKEGDYWIDLQTNYLKAIFMNDGVYPVWCCLAELSSEKEQFASLNRINHLHQLQNLYFALTGTELPIKL
jgi:hypothetical protein